MSSCANKSGLVTGASGGLGRAIVLDLAADGANVVALGRNIEGLRETAARAHGLAGTAEVLQADVTDEAAVISALAEVERRFGSVDFVVNNAGKQIERDLLDTTNEDWETIDATNVRGPFWVCKHAAAAMLRLGSGRQHRQHRLGAVGQCRSDAAGLHHEQARCARPHPQYRGDPSTCSCRNPRQRGPARRYGHPDGAAVFRRPRGPRGSPPPDQFVAIRSNASPTLLKLPTSVRFLISDDASFVNGASIVVDGGLGAALYTSP